MRAAICKVRFWASSRRSIRAIKVDCKESGMAICFISISGLISQPTPVWLGMTEPLSIKSRTTSSMKKGLPAALFKMLSTRVSGS